MNALVGDGTKKAMTDMVVVEVICLDTGFRVCYHASVISGMGGEHDHGETGVTACIRVTEEQKDD